MTFHKYTPTPVQTAAVAVNAGCNLELGLPQISNNIYSYLGDAVAEKLVNESRLREMVKPLFYTRMRLGEFDPPEMNPYTSFNLSSIQSVAHQSLAFEAATKSFVLLKNKNNLLPLESWPKKMAVVGPFANNIAALYGDYSPTIMKPFVSTPYSELSSIVGDKVTYAAGCTTPKCSTYNADKVIDAVKESDLVIVCLGTGVTIESEDIDRADLMLPGYQLKLLQDAYSVGKPTILVLYNAGPVDISWAKQNVDAILENFLPGQAAGKALLAILTGVVNPAGRLPYTWPLNMDQVPAMTNYSMEGRTYRYFKGNPLYPFGYGLSYTKFNYKNMMVTKEIKPCDKALVTGEVFNVGARDGDEVTQVYINWPNATVPVARMQLVGVKRSFIESGNYTKISFTIVPAQFAVYTSEKVIEPGLINVYLGGQQYGQETSVPSNVLQAVIQIQGTAPVPLDNCDEIMA